MAATSEALPVHEGDVVGDKYRLVRPLGHGGMALVWQAEHVHLNHKVALKFLRPSLSRSDEAVARFLREGRSAVQIQSEHVARVLDVGMVHGGVPFLAMEHLQGSDLARMCQARGALPVAETVDFVLQALEAVAEAHALGIVHRDLKPQNLFVVKRRDGTPLVKVLDFGISKAVDSPGNRSAKLTDTATVLGSPRYVPPEQLASSHDVDRRADIWGIGTILYELLTGKPAFDGETAAALAAAIMRDAPTRPRSLRSEIPRGLEAAVLRCLEKGPEKRFQNVGELAEALVPFAPKPARAAAERISRLLMAPGIHVSAPPPATLDDAKVVTLPYGAAGSTLEASLRAAASGAERRRATALALVAAGIVGVVALAGWLTWARPRSHARPGSSPSGDDTTTGSPATATGFSAGAGSGGGGPAPSAAGSATSSAVDDASAPEAPATSDSSEPSGRASTAPTGGAPTVTSTHQSTAPAGSTSGKRRLPKYGPRQ